MKNEIIISIALLLGVAGYNVIQAQEASRAKSADAAWHEVQKSGNDAVYKLKMEDTRLKAEIAARKAAR